MAESLCLRCHTRCSHCAPYRDNLTNVCLCDEMQTAHPETFHTPSSLQSDPLLSSVNLADQWTGDGQLDFLYNGQCDFLYDVSFGQPSPPNKTSNLAHAAVFHSIDLTTNDPRTNPPGDRSLLGSSPPITLTAVPNNGNPSHTSSHQETRPTQSSPPTNARRRDYTKEEKDEFEHWIANNPKPNRVQRVRFAQMHGLVKSQVDNLINNRKRDIRKAEKEGEQSAPRVKGTGGSAAKQGEHPFQADFRLESEPSDHEHDIDMINSASRMITRATGETSAVGLTHNAIILPVSEENLRRTLKEDSSYSSIDKYLRSREEAAPIESIQLAVQHALGKAASAAMAQLPKKSLNDEMLGPERKATCCLCTQMVSLNDEVVVFPCKRWFHEACIASYLDLWTSKDECPVCRQSITGQSQRPCPTFALLSSPTNIQLVLENYRRDLDRQIQIQSPRLRRTSQQGLRRNYSSQSLSRPHSKSNISSFHGSAASSVASATSSVHSYASSTSRIRAKKMRREKRTNAALGFACSFCDRYFSRRDHMLAHEVEEHCLPQTFPCTFCHLRFDSPVAWENHETRDHCGPQLTWFCMLDGDILMEKCVFCEDILPDVNHYETAHFLSPCEQTLESRTFTTRQYLMGHLIEIHGMTEEEVAPVTDELRFWALKLNVKHKRAGGIWRCGYCGTVGADWDNRIGHIIDHWNRGGPRFTQLHRWGAEQAKLDRMDYEYIRRLASGKEGGSIRPQNMCFHGHQIYEAAMRCRAKLDVRPFSRQKPCVNNIEDTLNRSQSPETSASPSLNSMEETDKMDTSPFTPPDPPPPSSMFSSFFASLAHRRKLWFNFTRQKRGQKK